MVQETLPAPVVAEAVEGEVIDPREQLKVHEANIKRNFKKMETVVQSVARSLNVIYHNGLWKLHTTADGKRRYTNFNDYLEVEFGWDKTAARARQIMKADLPLAIEAGEVPAEVGDKRRERTAPMIEAGKAASITRKQLAKVQEAWQGRMENVESGDALARLVDIIADANVAVDDILPHLDTFIEDVNAESETADDDDDADDDSDDS